MSTASKIPIGARVIHFWRGEFGTLLDPSTFLVDEGSSVVEFDNGDTLEVSSCFLEEVSK